MDRHPLVRKVLDAVDGSFYASDIAVKTLHDAGVNLSVEDANAIMASFLILNLDSRCVAEYGEGRGHQYFKSFGAKAPRYSYNQLHSTGLARRFHKWFIERRGLSIDQDLYRLFCSYFSIDTLTPTDPAAVDLTADVEAVVNAVTGNFRSANSAVVNLKNKGGTLTSAEANAILASFLMEQSDIRCKKLYGKDYGHTYLKSFGAKTPETLINQLHGGDGLAKNFNEWCIEERGVKIDPVLYGLFCARFGLGKAVWTNTEAASTYIDQQQADYREQLENAIKEKTLVVMAGIGVSTNIVPKDNRLTWSGLLDAIRTLLADRRNPVTIPDENWDGKKEEQKAQVLDDAVKEKSAHLDYRQFVSVIMRNVALPDTADFADAIEKLGLPIATTNYDLILDHCLKRFEKNVSEIDNIDNHSDFVYHVHGVWFDSTSVVLSEDDYDNTQVEFLSAMEKLLKGSPDIDKVKHRSLLFIGSTKGVVDKHFSALYTDPRFNHLTHFTILRRDTVKQLLDENPEFLNALKANKLVPIIYGDKYEELQPFIAGLPTSTNENPAIRLNENRKRPRDEDVAYIEK